MTEAEKDLMERQLCLPWYAGDDNAMVHGTPENPDMDEPPFLADFCAEPGMDDPDDKENMRAKFAAQAANGFLPMLIALRNSAIYLVDHGTIELGTPQSRAIIAGWQAAKGDGTGPVDINMPPEFQGMATYENMRTFIEGIARMVKEGEADDDGKEFVMENDDAFNTVHSLISDARALLGLPDRRSPDDLEEADQADIPAAEHGDLEDMAGVDRPGGQA